MDDAPEGDGWIHEIKYDGYRTELVIERGQAHALIRRGFDWTDKYGPIVKTAAKLPAKSAIIDGEVIVINEAGLSDFSTLRSAIRWEPARLVFVGFDLLHFEGKELRSRPLIERKAALEQLIGGAGHSRREARPRCRARRPSNGQGGSSAWNPCPPVRD